ncbi:CHAP domain-containing protein [Pelagibius sp. CAU 1746]|uniref:CHAP domain-containing protein n=1 Tax=Pelagibius sp. CAU 1746 TaxID=3140370 RepID=UPI00325B1159
MLLLLGACAAPLGPEAGSGSGETAAATPRAQIPKPLTTQQVARPDAPRLTEVTPAGFTALPKPPAPARPRPAIVAAKRPLQCVPYARELSSIALRGNAWTWWQKAEGRYERGSAPQVGSVLVLSKSRRLRLGHLAYVAEVVSSREIIVHQANWLNRGQIHRYTPVRDVSKNNDWSLVRVWYTPGQQMGSGHYPAYGFIYPKTGGTPELRQAAN